MKRILRKLFPGMLLVAAVAAVLLLLDLSQRRATTSKNLPRVAVMLISSRPVMEECARGFEDAIVDAGYVLGKDVIVQTYNAEGDLATAHTIAKTVVGGGFDVAVTFSTPALQVMAQANREGKATHIFGCVTDPYAAGVGITGPGVSQHPRHLAGVGTFQPVREIFQLLKQIKPSIKVAGTVWCPGESCSQACLALARDECGKLGITLLEATVDRSSDVGEAAQSLVSRGAQALWIGGDNVVEVASDSVVHAGREGGVPVFVNAPQYVESGALFGLGADYVEVGHLVGEMAVKVLRGTDPASFQVQNVVPRKLAVNLAALSGLRGQWEIPENVLGQAAILIQPDGKKVLGKGADPTARPGQSYSIGIAYFAPELGVETAMRGLMDGLSDLGFKEGENLVVRRAHAQAEIVNIPPMLQALDNGDVQAIATMTTPVLTAACATVKRKPVVFAYCVDPVAAGAGKSMTDHLPFVTGTGSFPPVEETVDIIRSVFPGMRRLGTLYNSGEANSTRVVAVLREVCAKAGIELVEVTASSSVEVAQAAQAVVARGVSAVYIPCDNTAYQSFDALVQATRGGRVGLVIDQGEFTGQGALMAVGVDFYQSGKAAARQLARVLLGDKPGEIPMQNLPGKTICLNDPVAKSLGVKFPPALVEDAKKFGLEKRNSISGGRP